MYHISPGDYWVFLSASDHAKAEDSTAKDSNSPKPVVVQDFESNRYSQPSDQMQQLKFSDENSQAKYNVGRQGFPLGVEHLDSNDSISSIRICAGEVNAEAHQNCPYDMSQDVVCVSKEQLLDMFSGVVSRHREAEGTSISLASCCERHVAIKSVPLTAHPSLVRAIWRERLMLTELPHHRSIVRLHCRPMFVTETNLNIVLEYIAGGDLLDFLTCEGTLDDSTARQIIRAIAEGLDAIHSFGYVHCDVKPENIMLSVPNDPSSAKLIDFGACRPACPLPTAGSYMTDIGESPTDAKCLLTRISDASTSHPPEVMLGISGTAGYMAPEVALGGKPACKSDVFSLGIVLYFMLAGYHPFMRNSDFTDGLVSPCCQRVSLNVFSVLRRNRDGLVDFEHPVWRSVSDTAKDIIRRMCCTNPDDRIEIRDVLEHPWLSE